MKQTHLEITVNGMVQGIGFRPYVHRLALAHHLRGSVSNCAQGARIHVQGDHDEVISFVRALGQKGQPAHIMEMQTKELPLQAWRGFVIEDSEQGESETFVVPDLAPCASCLQELQDPKDRRYRYPFINCTHCGPRYTIIQGVPYDRAKTTMNAFTMCDACAKEYQTIDDRRYHAQPNACDACGPHVCYYDRKKQPLAWGEQALALACADLARGNIVAIKGVGGIHLACDAMDSSALRKLRARKRRSGKPLAVMVRDVKTARRFVHVDEAEERLLQSRERPIVLCRKKDRRAHGLLSENQEIGIFLPYSPLHVLVMETMEAIVLTSANPEGEPVIIDNAQALAQLDSIADAFLLHERKIENRCDDSLVRAFRGRPYFIRRSRGYAPLPFATGLACEGILAAGAHQKGSFALGKRQYAFVSPYIGDMEHWQTMIHYHSSLSTYQRLFGVHPTHVVCDLHPDYASTQFAHTLHLPLLEVQHHHAHMASCMIQHQLTQEVFGIIWDGSGMGNDGTTWGGEFLIGDLGGFRRVASIHPITLAGGEKAVMEIGRTALALCVQSGLSRKIFDEPKQRALTALCQNESLCVRSSSIGRLFDGVYALLSQNERQCYDAEAPVLLESMAACGEQGSYPLTFYEQEGVRRFDWRVMLRALLAQYDDGVSGEIIAARFMNTLCRMALDQCVHCNPKRLPVVLSGGSFLNAWLLEKIVSLLERAGFTVYWHTQTSCNDEGIALGQLAIGAYQRAKERVKKGDDSHVFSYPDENHGD